MSSVDAMPLVKCGDNNPPSVSPAAPASVAFRYTQTDSFVALQQQLGASLVVSTYHANKLLVVRGSGNGISILVRTFERPMGLAVDAQWLSIGARNQIWFLRNAPDIASQVEPAATHDACFLPRSSHVTGDIGVHEIARVGEDLWLVSTRFSCLCTLDADYSFVPRWRPPFVTAPAAERGDERLLSAELLRPKRSGGPIQITQTVSGCSELSTTPLDFLISKNL